MGHKKTAGQMPEKSASLVGFSMLLLVLLQQAAALVARRLAPVQAQGTPEALVLPEWLAGLVGLLLAVLCLLIPLFFLQRAGRTLGYALHRGKSRVPVWVLLPLFMGVVVVANSVATLLRTLVSALLGLQIAPAPSLPESGTGIFFYFLTVCVASPVLEELFFRGTVQQLLRFWGPRFAVLLTSVMFALLHISLWELPTVLVLSFLLGYIYEVSRSVRSCIALHFANNLVAFLMRLARERMQTNAAFALIMWMMVLFVALFVGSVWAARYFKLWRKLKLRRDVPGLGPIHGRLRRIARVPLFTLGMLALAAQFIVGLAA